MRTRRPRRVHGEPPLVARSRRVLIVEDEAMIGFELQTMVRNLGHSVVAVASNESEAVRLGIKMKPDVVLMDVRLGSGSDGVTAARRILRHRPVEIIFCTGYSHDRGTIEHIRQLGSFQILAKPFSVSELETALDRLPYRP